MKQHLNFNDNNDSNANWWRTTSKGGRMGDEECNLFDDEHAKQQQQTGSNSIRCNSIGSGSQFMLSSSTKTTKNYPSFTIIIRRKLKVDNNNNNNNYSKGLPNKIDKNRINQMTKKELTTTKTTTNNMLVTDGVGSSHSDSKSSIQDDNQIKLNEQDSNIDDDYKFSMPWQLWLLGSNGQQTEDNFWNVKQFGQATDSAKKFWSLYMNIYHLFDRDEQMKSVMIFRDGVEPKWEHESNVGGGRWFFDLSYIGNAAGCNNQTSISPITYQQHSFQQQPPAAPKHSDYLIKANHWTQCMQMILSQSLGQPWSEMIVGMVLLFKSSKYRISLWVKTCDDFNQIIALGSRLQKHFQLRFQMKYELHHHNNHGNNLNKDPINNIQNNEEEKGTDDATTK